MTLFFFSYYMLGFIYFSFYFSKQLSSCQKTCKFLPRKSTTTPTINTTTTATTHHISLKKEKGLAIERNKVDEEMKRIPVTSKPIPVKPDDSSPGLEITPSDTGLFHLQWPKISSSPTSKKWMPVVVYTVILQDNNNIDALGTWKLIDQTVAQHTEISLVVNVCHHHKKLSRNSTSSSTSSAGLHDHNIIRVFAVSSQGLEKLFSGYLSCNCQSIQQKQQQKNLQISRQSESSSETFDKNSKTLKGISSKTKAESKVLKSIINSTTNGTIEGVESEAIKSAKPTESPSWGLQAVSMVYENFLVVTEVSWAVPNGLSNHEESVTRERSEDGIKNQKYHFLLTWEIFGGGLRGNLVTDSTSGTVSLWPDTAYFIQVREKYVIANSVRFSSNLSLIVVIIISPFSLGNSYPIVILRILTPPTKL